MNTTRRLVIGSVTALAVLLVIGRFAAHAFADQLWFDSLNAGEAKRLYTLGWWSRLAWLSTAAAWLWVNLYVCCRGLFARPRAIRIGNIEIAQHLTPVLVLSGSIVVSLLLAFAMSSGSGEWWMARALAREHITMGITDPVLGRDVGEYLTQLPWLVWIQRYASRLLFTTLILVTTLYVGIGTVSVRDRRVEMVNSTRRHVVLVLALFAISLAWSWSSLGRMAVAGLLGDSALGDPSALISAAAILPVLGLMTAGVTLPWIIWDRPLLPALGWVALALAWLALRVIAPLGGSGPPTAVNASLAHAAFGIDVHRVGPIQMDSGLTLRADELRATVAGVPIWDRDALIDVFNLTRAAGNARVLRDLDLIPHGWIAPEMVWRGAAGPDLNRMLTRTDGNWTPTTATLVEYDASTGAPRVLDGEPMWYAPRLGDYVLGDTVPAGIDLSSASSRLILAWHLQSLRILSSRGRLLWRRDPAERLERLAPFAEFHDPYLARVNGRNVWVLDGYLVSNVFPGIPGQRWNEHNARYVRAAFVGTVDAVSGATAVYRLPDIDAYAQAWADITGGFVGHVDDMPDELRRQLRYPESLFRFQADWVAQSIDSLAGGPFQRPNARRGGPLSWIVSALPDDSTRRLVISIPLSGGSPLSFEAILAGTVVGGQPQLHALQLDGWAIHSRAPLRVGGDSTAGVRHVWPVAGALFSQQTIYTPVGRGSPALTSVNATWGARVARAPTRPLAVEEMLLYGGRTAQVPDIWGRWARAQALLRQADSLLNLSDFAGFGRVYEELKRVLDPTVGRR